MSKDGEGGGTGTYLLSACYVPGNSWNLLMTPSLGIRKLRLREGDGASKEFKLISYKTRARFSSSDTPGLTLASLQALSWI